MTGKIKYSSVIRMSDKQYPKFWAVVPAAGAGKRMGSEKPKKYQPHGDRTELEQNQDTQLYCTRLSCLVIALSNDHEHWYKIQSR